MGLGDTLGVLPPEAGGTGTTTGSSVKVLWTGSALGGTINVPGASRYKLFLIKVARNGISALAYPQNYGFDEQAGSTYFYGSFIINNGKKADFIATLRFKISGNAISSVGDRFVSGISEAPITSIIGLC